MAKMKRNNQKKETCRLLPKSLTENLAGLIIREAGSSNVSRGVTSRKKTEVATGRKRNAFLTGKVPSIATDYYMESQTDETEKNLTTSENFDFLYRSALRYAGLMGIKLPFRPRKGAVPA